MAARAAIRSAVIAGALSATMACAAGGENGNSASNSPAAPSVSSSAPVTFNAAAQLPQATVGADYRYSFCEPAPSGPNDLCRGTNPSGGQPPYHFQLDTGGGFPPLGLTLAPNGLLTGKPSAAGEKPFTVCAVDLAAKSVCRKVSLNVVGPITGLKFNYSCKTRTEPFYTMTCTGTADFSLNVTAPSGFIVVVMPYGGAEFHGDANVSPKEGGPGQVHIANFTMTTTQCLPTYTTFFQVWGGILGSNPPLLAVEEGVKGATTCS